MKSDYEDIRSRIAEEPSWFNEDGVPRYGKFHPSNLSNIYSHEGALVDVACQSCGHLFKVAFSSSFVTDKVPAPITKLISSKEWNTATRRTSVAAHPAQQ